MINLVLGGGVGCVLAYGQTGEWPWIGSMTSFSNDEIVELSQ